MNCLSLNYAYVRIYKLYRNIAPIAVYTHTRASIVPGTVARSRFTSALRNTPTREPKLRKREMAENELANKLRHRTDIIDRDEAGLQPEPVRYSVKRNVYAEFAEFTRKQIQAYQKMFDKLVGD